MMVALTISAFLAACLCISFCSEYNCESRNLSYNVEILTEQLSLGEAPHWKVNEQLLYFVDINEPSVHSYNPATTEHFSAIIKGNRTVSFIIPIEGEEGRFVISHKNDLAIISWDGKNQSDIEPEIVATLESEDNDRRINDGKADPKGRLWTGTMTEAPFTSTYPSAGSLYSWSATDNTVTKHVDGIKLSNGLAWSLDNTTMYYADTLKYAIFIYDYNVESGNITNERTFFNYTETNTAGCPDGMTIDKEGNLIVASVNGSEIIYIDGNSGQLIWNIEVPTKYPTSVAIGGANLDELYVTSGNIGEGFQPIPSPNDNATSGRLLRITGIEFQGIPAMNIISN